MKGGAKVGDVVAVTGPLGLAAAGFEVLLNEESGKVKSDYRISGYNTKLKLLKRLWNLKTANKGLKLGQIRICKLQQTDITDDYLVKLAN
jgi:thiamine-monophosphate kinase